MKAERAINLLKKNKELAKNRIMELIQTASKDQIKIDTQVRILAALYTEEDFEMDPEGALKITKATFFSTLKMEEMTIAQEETVEIIFNLLNSIWGKH